MAFPNATSPAAVLACGALIASIASAQSQKASEAAATRAAATFAPPVRVMAGSKLMGAGRLYPSPVFQDMNGDGLADVVIGDLMGRITVALRAAGDGPAAWGAETRLKANDGKDLKFSNW